MTYVSANEMTRWDYTDVNGDNVFDAVRLQANYFDAASNTLRYDYTINADQSTGNWQLTFVSANGLVVNHYHDLNADGIYEFAKFNTTVINADGSRTTQENWLDGGLSVERKATTTVSANGLITTAQNDYNADNVIDRTMTDTTVLAANGGTTRTLEERSGDNSLRSKTVIAVSGLTTVPTVQGVGEIITTNTDSHGFGFNDLINIREVRNNGEIAETESTFASTGQLLSKRTEVYDGKIGLTTTQFDVDGNATVDTTIERKSELGGGQFQSLASWLSNSGSSNGTVGDNRVTTVTVKNGDGSLRSTTKLVEGLNGLAREFYEDMNGDGIAERATRTSITLNADGSTLESEVTKSADGAIRSNREVLTSDDGESVQRAYDHDGNGTQDRQENWSISANGNSVYSRYNLSATGTTLSWMTETAHLNGLVWARTWDLNGDNVVDRTTNQSNVVNANGSTTTVFGSQGVGASATTLRSSVTSTVSDDGLITSAAYDGIALAWAANHFKRTVAATTTYAAEGTRTETISTTSPTSTLLNRYTMTTSGNGLVSTFATDANGNGTNERYVVATTFVDGSKSDYWEMRTTSGALIGSEWISTDWRGLVKTLWRDTNADGAFDVVRTETTTADRVFVETSAKTSTRGGLNDYVTTIADGNQLLTTMTVDFNTDNRIDERFITTLANSANGSRTTTVTHTNVLGRTVNSTTDVISDDGMVSTLTADISGDGAADYTTVTTTTLAANGTRSTNAVSHYASGTFRATVTESVSADSRTTTWQSDMDGNGYASRLIVSAINADESTSRTTQYFSSVGNLVGQDTTTVSADELTVRRQWANGIIETTELLPEANGSYVWTSNQGGSLVSAHAISDSGVDTWTVNENGVIRTVSMTIDTHRYLHGLAAEVYGVVLDREMTSRDSELLIRYLTGGTLNATQLTTDLLATAEFQQRFGTLTNAQFIERVFQNAFDRAATLDELSFYLAKLQNATMTRAGLSLSLAEFAQYDALGSEHAPDQYAPGSQTYALDRIFDRSLADAFVERLYGTMLDRSATAAEMQSASTQLTTGAVTQAALAGTLLSSTEFIAKYGSLTDAQFVETMFMNGLLRLPTTAEAAQWSTMLCQGTISRQDLGYAVATSIDYYTLAGGRPNVLGTTGNDTLFGSGSQDKLVGGLGIDTLLGLAGGDVYLYRRGDGNDVIDDTHSFAHNALASEIDVLRFADLNRADISFATSGTSNIVSIIPTGHQITLSHQNLGAGSYAGLERIEFADGQVVTWQHGLGWL